MALKELVVAVSLLAAAPVSATKPAPDPTAGAPAAGENARYCLRIEAVTGSRIEEVKCWTRREWAEQEVDVDREWAKEGVAVLG